MPDFFGQGKQDAAASLARGDTPEYMRDGNYNARERYNGGVAAAIAEQAKKSQQGGN